MKRASSIVLSFALLLAVASEAWAQKYAQPWTPPRPAFESRVISCQNPNPATAGWKVAMDDWICPQTGRIVRVEWWGIVLTQAQLNVPGAAQHRYVIRVWNDNPNLCRALQPFFTACVVPTNVLVGQDCQNNRVYRFSAPLPAATPFNQVAGTHYWMQISEDDQTSARPGLEDFRWSAHRPLRYCPAMQIDAAGVVTQPLIDPCDNQPDDLSFRMYNQTIIIVCIPCITSLSGAAAFTMELRSPTSGALVETVNVDADKDGMLVAGPDSPDGNYEMTLYGNGMKPIRMMVQLQNGMETQMSFFDVFFGDLNLSGAIDGDDIGIMVRGLLNAP